MNRTPSTINENKMPITGATLTRLAGLAAVVGGLIYAGIQPIHPADALSSVNTTAWAIITPLKVVMSMLFLVGLTGIYVHQVKESGLLGLIGFVLFSVAWALELAYIFAEAFIIPALATAAPTFIEGFFGIINGHPVATELGALPGIYGLLGGLYVIGGLLFGIATFRAHILPRPAAGLLAITCLLTPLAALLPHEIQRFAAMPVGIAIAALGYALWSERQARVTSAAVPESAPASQTGSAQARSS